MINEYKSERMAIFLQVTFVNSYAFISGLTHVAINNKLPQFLV
jgi:hypothetical protein